tara:strand:+ start:1216 stop:1842 length:627 start_codon:yes stop_codon:yes gene_type:complete
MINKSVDIDQLVDYEVLEMAILEYLKGSYSEEYILEQLRINISGENRIKKGLRIVKKVVLNNQLSSLICENKSEVIRALNNKDDKSIIIISLLNSAFPFAYDLLSIFGKFFKVQDLINIKVIQKEVSKVYGGNRVAVNGIYCVGPIFEKAGIYSRPKQGLYQIEDKLRPIHSVTKKIFIESFNINQSITPTIIDELNPYFQFITFEKI